MGNRIQLCAEDLAYFVAHRKIISLVVWGQVKKSQGSLSDLMAVPVAVQAVFLGKTPPTAVETMVLRAVIVPAGIGVSCEAKLKPQSEVNLGSITLRV